MNSTDLTNLTYSPLMNRSPRPYNQHVVTNHFQKQIDLVQQSRASASPHHRARQAMASRSNSNLNLTEDSNKPSEWTALDLGGMLIKIVSASLFRYDFLTSLYLNHNMLQAIPPEIRLLQNLSTLDISGNKLKALAPEIGLIPTLKELLAFDNELTILPYEFGSLYQLESLGLAGNPMQEMIMGMLQKDGAQAVIRFLRDHCPEGLPPPEREWIVLDNESTSDGFTILCYNTLSDKYAVPTSYGYTPSWVLDWNYRKELLTQEILNYSADIICLQEIETCMYMEYFQPLLSQEYEGFFSAKSRARTMDEYSRRGVDGCATFFKKSKFTLKDSHTVEFQIIATKRPDLCKTEDVYNRVMIKDNIATFVLLEHKETRQMVIVGNAHLHWDPQFRDVKVVQTAMLTEELEKFAKRHFGNRKADVILCGDFNSLWDSGVVEYLLAGQLPPDHPDFNGRTYGQYTSQGLSHSLQLKSSYPKGTIELTNFTPMFKGVIDHLFYSGLVCTGILGGIDPSYLVKCVGFPNWHHPSDHIPLLASYRFLN